MDADSDGDERSNVRPSELKEKLAAKIKEIRINQKRDLPRVARTEDEQRVVRYIYLLFFLVLFHRLK